LNDVRFVKAVLLVTALTFPIDRFRGDTVAKTIAQNFAKFSGDGIAVVTLGTVTGELRVTRRNFTGIKKSFAPATWEKKNRKQAAEDRQQTDDKSRAPPGMKPAVITEVAFVTLGDLLLRSGRLGHVTPRTRNSNMCANVTA